MHRVTYKEMDRVVRYDCTSLELSQTQMNCLRVLAALKPDKIILLSRCCGRPLVVGGGLVRVLMWYECTA